MPPIGVKRPKPLKRCALSPLTFGYHADRDAESYAKREALPNIVGARADGHADAGAERNKHAEAI